jgi:NitT/TauT family transport system ATP-binding protein
MTSPKVIAKDVTKRFRVDDGNVTALSSVSLQVDKGEFCSIVGPSGCGKSTFLRLVAQLETFEQGSIRIMREEPSRPLCTMIFQEQSAFPWMTVRGNIGYGLRMRGVQPSEVKRVVDYYLEAVRLKQFATAYPYQLSGGMRQRVSIARAFANDPELLLMDEPFAALDALTKVVMADELLSLWEQSKKTVIYVTHSLEEAILLSDRVVVMTARPGRIKAEIAVDFPRPRNPDIKDSAHFGELHVQIWNLLRDEVTGVALGTGGKV